MPAPVPAATTASAPSAHLPPPAEKARFVRGMFDAIAARYDLMNRLMTGLQDERWRRIAVDAVYPETIAVALDVGAGTGDLSFALAGAAPQARVVAVDFSEGMLRVAGRKAAQRGGGRVVPLLGDAMRLPVADGEADAAVSGFTLRNVVDVAGAFAELYRVLRPGGRLAVLELTPLERSRVPGFAALFRLYFRRVVPLLGGLVSGRGYAYRYLPESVGAFPDADRLAAMLREAGFEGVAFRRMALGTVALHVAAKPREAAPAPLRVLPAPPAAAAGTTAGGGPLAVREVRDAGEWNDLLAAVPNAHILQCWEWGELKRETGWVPRRLVFEREGVAVAAASVSRRPLPGLPAGIAYCQKGPALDYADTALLGDVLRRLADDARGQRCVFVKVDPDVEWSDAAAVGAIRGAEYVPAPAQVQARSTVITDLRGSEADLQARMSQTWRRYIRKASRDGVTVRTGTLADLPRFYELYEETERRQSFIIRPYAYYESALRRLTAAGLAELFMADAGGQAEATMVACALGKRAWYLWGASSTAGMRAHAPHLLQWHTMQWARDRGCETYDMWGAPDDPADKSDPLSGVYYFKQGFGGRHVRMAGAYDRVLSAPLYRLLEIGLPRYIALLRALRGERPAAAGHE